MSLRWTEEELEEYQRRIRETVERANGALRDTAESLRKFADGEEISSDPPQAAAHLPHRGKAVGMVPTEDEEQVALFDWARVNEVKWPELSRLFHVPNGGSRGPAEAGRFKAMGVRKGVPDVFLDVPRGRFHGLRIEMKRRRGGVLSDEQVDWLDYYNANGYRAVVCYGWDEARTEIEGYLRGGRIMNIPAIKRNCVRKKRFEIVDDLHGGQWIGNGQAWWAVEGIAINEGCIAELFDLNEKQQDKCLITREASKDRRFKRIIDRDEAGDVCDDLGAVFFNGWMMRAIQHDRHGMMFLLVDNLKPAAADDEYCTFYALEVDGDMMVAVYNGFFCTALVRPVDGNLPEIIQDKLRRMADAPLYIPDAPSPAEAAAEEMAEQMGI